VPTEEARITLRMLVGFIQLKYWISF